MFASWVAYSPARVAQTSESGNILSRRSRLAWPDTYACVGLTRVVAEQACDHPSSVMSQADLKFIDFFNNLVDMELWKEGSSRKP
jgi:hypothetical protein